jgi:hypothetical protein
MALLTPGSVFAQAVQYGGKLLHGHGFFSPVNSARWHCDPFP